MWKQAKTPLAAVGGWCRVIGAGPVVAGVVVDRHAVGVLKNQPPTRVKVRVCARARARVCARAQGSGVCSSASSGVCSSARLGSGGGVLWFLAMPAGALWGCWWGGVGLLFEI